MTNQYEDEEPLDPAMERVRKRMVRLLVISIGIMAIGLMAVFGAIVYKIGNMPEEGGSATNAAESKSGSYPLQSEINLGLPTGAAVLSADLFGNRLLLNIVLIDGQKQILVVDLERGKVSSRINLSAQP